MRRLFCRILVRNVKNSCVLFVSIAREQFVLFRVFQLDVWFKIDALKTWFQWVNLAKPPKQRYLRHKMFISKVWLLFYLTQVGASWLVTYHFTLLHASMYTSSIYLHLVHSNNNVAINYHHVFMINKHRVLLHLPWASALCTTCWHVVKGILNFYNCRRGCRCI